MPRPAHESSELTDAEKRDLIKLIEQGRPPNTIPVPELYDSCFMLWKGIEEHFYRDTLQSDWPADLKHFWNGFVPALGRANAILNATRTSRSK